MPPSFKNELLSFLKNKMCHYNTGNNIFIYSDGLPEIQASASLVDSSSPITLTVTSISPDVETFIANHQLESIDDLEKINSGLLMELFWKGKAELYFNSNDFILWYEVIQTPAENGPGTFQVKTFNDEVYIITETLREPEDFLQHGKVLKQQIEHSRGLLPPEGPVRSN